MVQFSQERLANPTSTIVRGIGIVILLCGLYSAWLVAGRAWRLLDKPEIILPYAEEIEKQTHLNQFVGQLTIIVDFINKAKSALPVQPNQVIPTVAAPVPVAMSTFNASYFSAWVLVVLLLGLIGKISFWAISEGGRLALYGGDGERQLRLVLQQLLAEARRAPMECADIESKARTLT